MTEEKKSEAIQPQPKALAPKSTAAQLTDLLTANQKAISSLVPKHLTPERLMRVAVNCVAKTPDLGKCTPSSLLSCVMQAAELGLEPGGALGQFYLVPFGNVATPIIGYRGLLSLARRSGEISFVRAVVVHEKDEFRLMEGIEQTIHHERYLKGHPGEMAYVYAVAKLKDGSVQIEVMSRAEVDAIRARSRSGRSGPWVTDYEEMAKKTVFRRLAKWLPLSSDEREAKRYEAALELDNAEYIEGAAEAVTTQAPEVKERVRRKLEAVEMPALPTDAEENTTQHNKE